MAKIQCKMCGGQVGLQDGITTGECPYCGSLTTFPKLDTEQREQLYARAEHFRQANNFDKAVAAYESILDLDGTDPEAWWGLLISKYGIEYVEDPASHERIPTCHRVQFDSILADPDYLNALKYALGYDRKIYEKEAHRIAEIQKDILRISSQEKPYDVFICCKETTDGGMRTNDSVLAQDIYFQLTKQGLKVFFSRITLEKKLVQQYEPYIFAALNSAKVMLVVGTKKEHFEDLRVKNEWSRFLALKKKDPSKLLIPCFVYMDAYDIPEELSMFQCRDMNRTGFMQDLLYGILKVVKPAGNEDADASGNTRDDIPEIENIKKRAAILVAQDDWEKAVLSYEKELESNPENAEMYFLICMLFRRIPDENALRNSSFDIYNDTIFQTALKYASPERKKQIESVARNAAVNFYLKKCMEKHHAKDPSNLVKCRTPLTDDPDFRLAMSIAVSQTGLLLSAQAETLKRLVTQQAAWQAARRWIKTGLEVCALVVVIVILFVLWFVPYVKKQEKVIMLPGNVEMEMRMVPAGSFVMSAQVGYNDHNEVAHKATLKRDFFIGRTEVTQAQWEAVMGTSPSHFNGDDLPVEMVSWDDAMEFCEKLNKSGIAPEGWRFTLPTETQWEYAAHGGRNSKTSELYGRSYYYFLVGWTRGNSVSKTHPVGLKDANKLGLYDMSGNVREWCLDDWIRDSSMLTAEFKRGIDGGSENRAIRGGGWDSDDCFCRLSARDAASRDTREKDLGFRVALVPKSD